MLIDRRQVHKKSLYSSVLCVVSRTSEKAKNVLCKSFPFLGVHDFPWVVSQQRKKTNRSRQNRFRSPTISFELLGNEKFSIHKN